MEPVSFMYLGVGALAAVVTNLSLECVDAIFGSNKIHDTEAVEGRRFESSEYERIVRLLAETAEAEGALTFAGASGAAPNINDAYINDASINDASINDVAARNNRLHG